MIESLHSSVQGSPMTWAQTRKSDIEQISELLDSLSDVDNLRNRISYLMTYVPPEVIYPNVEPGNSGSYDPGNSGGVGYYDPNSGYQGNGEPSYEEVLQKVQEIVQQYGYLYPQYTYDELVQVMLDQWNSGLVNPAIRARRRFRRSSDSGLSASDVVYSVTSEVTKSSDLELLKDNSVSRTILIITIEKFNSLIVIDRNENRVGIHNRV